MSRDDPTADESTSSTELSSHLGSDDAGTHHHEVPEHEYWDFLPVHPPLSDERPDNYPESASDEDAYQAYYESICGTVDESKPVGLYDGEFPGVSTEFVETHAEPVGQLQFQEDLGDLEVVYEDASRFAGDGWCSGTLIDDDLLLTAGHCFMIDNMLRPSEIARHMQVNFNYQLDSDGEVQEVDSYEIVELVEHRFEHSGIDYAIVKLERTPGETFGTANIAGSDAAEGDRLCLISHPNQMPKRVEAGEATHIHDDRVGYGDLTTADGSSGAGILAVSSGKLVGIHTMGGCDATRRSHNHGVRIEPLLQESKILCELADGRTWTGTPDRAPTGPTSVSQQPTQTAGTGQTDGAGHAHHGESNHDGSGDEQTESHLSTLESHLSTLESHLSTLESDHASLESHLSTLESQEQMLDLMQMVLQVQRQTLTTSTKTIGECLDAIEECSNEIKHASDDQETTRCE